jgi:DNA-binding transcriptional MocR family regulator
MGDAKPTKHQINLLRGWPNPSLLPTTQIQAAANVALSDSSVSTPGLLYGPDPGYQPLRQSISKWLDDFYSPTLSSIQPSSQPSEADAERICITGGASQNLACVLQVYTDPVYTQVWMVAPCYFLACRIFEDAGLRTRAVAEGEEGVDLVGLERRLIETEKEMAGKVSFLLLWLAKERDMGVEHGDHVTVMFSLLPF